VGVFSLMGSTSLLDSSLVQVVFDVTGGGTCGTSSSICNTVGEPGSFSTELSGVMVVCKGA
jgi:hypothetical protein